MITTPDLSKLFQQLTGQTAPLGETCLQSAAMLLSSKGIGLSQLNETLLLLGHNRVTSSFFQYLLDGTVSLSVESPTLTVVGLTEGVSRFRCLAALRFGNIKFAFKYFSALDQSQFLEELQLLSAIPDRVFGQRHEPVQPIEPIPGDETFYLGYLVGAEIDDRLQKNPNDSTAIADAKKRKSLVEQGIRNHNAYLASDHMDVYIATSMRAKDEYFIVNALAKKIFESDRLRPLKLRWFDPTQAYCVDRLDKGLSEALMLKRAACTLYLAQESDTLGKDSELASTLAQGKPVIAFIPEIKENDNSYIDWLWSTVRKLYPDDSESGFLAKQFQRFDPNLPWTDRGIRDWLNDSNSSDITKLQSQLRDVMRKHYDKRAGDLKERHPLGIQVHLETGVANGVLVARTTDQCAELIRRVVTNTLEFNIEDKLVENRPYMLLRDRLTGSIFRMVSGDPLLTNSFWNYYLA